MACAFLLGAAALFFWPLWVLGHRFPKGSGDLWGLWYPVWSFVAHWLRQGVFPLWDPLMMGGDPIFSDVQYGLLNPLNWPLFLTSPIPHWMVLLRGAFPLWLAGAGLYLYLRSSSVWRLKRASALVGATAYMFSDPFVVHLGNPPFNDAMAWWPWVLLGVDRAIHSARNIPLAALAVALPILSGHGEMTLYAAFATGLYTLWQMAEGGWPEIFYRMGRLLLAGVLGVALSAPALLPGIERLPFTERAGTPWELRRGYEFPPSMLVDFLSPAFHGRGPDEFWPSWNPVESGYVGAVALYLAGIGLVGNHRHRRTWFLVVLGLLTYALALGYRGPIYPLVNRLPLIEGSLKTARSIFLLSFALAILAAQGVECLGRRWRGTPFWALGLLLGGLLLGWQAPAWVSAVPEGLPRLRALTGLRFAALLAGTTAFLGWAANRGHRWGRAGLLLLLLAELVATGALAETEPTPKPDSTHTAALAFLRADPGWFRVDVDPTARGLWPHVFLQMEGFEVPQGMGNAMDLRSFNILRWRIPSATHPAYRMLGVKYLIVPKGAPPGGEGIWPVFIDDPTVDIHLNTLALPRAWLVYRTEVVESYGEALEKVLDENFRPEEVAVVQNGPQLNGTGEGSIEVGYYGPNDVVFFVETSAPALLVLSDTFYPGWQATVDGQPVPVYPTNAAFRGVQVPQGRHRVEMHFRPRSLMMGLGMAGAGGLGCLTLWLIRKRDP
ncbi:MAG: YfhO family protein [Anaerolineae bacterium]|nr:YfhO family protein [Anaerolineae bacterium]MDW8068914.1 YfhO family protein [Anaerolineae bacterium]